jgi:hypothetical protein
MHNNQHCARPVLKNHSQTPKLLLSKPCGPESLPVSHRTLEQHVIESHTSWQGSHYLPKGVAGPAQQHPFAVQNQKPVKEAFKNKCKKVFRIILMQPHHGGHKYAGAGDQAGSDQTFFTVQHACTVHHAALITSVCHHNRANNANGSSGAEKRADSIICTIKGKQERYQYRTKHTDSTALKTCWTRENALHALCCIMLDAGIQVVCRLSSVTMLSCLHTYWSAHGKPSLRHLFAVARCLEIHYL